MAESIVKWKGDAQTCHAAVALTGGRFVALTGAAPDGGNPVVGLPAAGARVYGVATTDAAAGTKVGVHRPNGGQVVPVEASVALAPGQLVTPTATGAAAVAAAGQHIAGQVVEGAAAGAQALVDVQYLGAAV